MNISKTISPYKCRINLAFFILFSILFSINTFAQFGYVYDLVDLSTETNTGDKPQSKVWKYDGQWWCVMPSSAPITTGTWLFRLNNTTWEAVIKLNSYTNNHADCKVDGSTTYVLLVRTSKAELYKLTYSGGTYASSSFIQTITTDVHETATIDIDGSGKMWCAWDASNSDINVSWSSSPYSTWSSAITLDNTGDTDDICAVTAFDGKIGVLWSNQPEEEFQFKYHTDGANENTWSSLEHAASGNGGCGSNKLCGIADDHINFAVSSDGTLYAAVKTSLNDNGGSGIQIGLLKRSTSPSWSFYDVSNTGTRPIALLNETEGVITVIYTDNNTSSDNIVYRQSDLSASISFGSKQPFIAGSYNNVTSTKQNYTDEVVILADGSSVAAGVTAYTNDPTPVELSSFTANLLIDKVVLNWRTETEVNNYGFNIERARDNNYDWTTIAFVEGHGNSNSPKEYTFNDSEIEQSGNYSYRLKQIDNDGTYEYYGVISVEVGVPDNFYLSQNYPNPFNPETRIDYTLPEKQFASLRIYNTLGEMVVELVNEIKEAGSYSAKFDASNLPSGVYIYRLQTSSFAANKKMTLLR